MDYSIHELEREKWQGHEIIFRDYADSCFKVSMDYKDDTFSASISKTPLAERKQIKYPNTLFGSWLNDVKAWGVIESERLIAVIETASSGNNRLYISELWVDEDYRRRGIASALMNVAKQRAVDEKRRMIFLETRCINEHAIDFYISQGFMLIGFDSCAYSNEDIETNNVPLKFGFIMGDKKLHQNGL